MPGGGPSRRVRRFRLRIVRGALCGRHVAGLARLQLAQLLGRRGEELLVQLRCHRRHDGAHAHAYHGAVDTYLRGQQHGGDGRQRTGNDLRDRQVVEQPAPLRLPAARISRHAATSCSPRVHTGPSPHPNIPHQRAAAAFSTQLLPAGHETFSPAPQHPRMRRRQARGETMRHRRGRVLGTPPSAGRRASRPWPYGRSS